MNRQWFRDQLASYLKDATLSAEIETFIDLGAARVYDVLECREMEQELGKTTTEEYIPYPADHKRTLSVQTRWNGSWRNLRSMPRMDADIYRGYGIPQFYYIERNRIYFAPYIDGTYRLIYLQSKDVGDQHTADPIATYPRLFLGAMLAEAYDWKEDPEMANNWRDKWLTDAQAISTRYQSERAGDVPVMRAS